MQAGVGCKDTSRGTKRREARELENFGKFSEIFSVEHHRTTTEGLSLDVVKAIEVAALIGNALVGAVHMWIALYI